MRNVLSIQYLRALAAIAVLIFHVCERDGMDFRVGAAGVDLFFVISGFIMWITTHGRDVTAQDFMRRRIERVVPVYWIATLITFVAVTMKPQFFYGHDASPANLAGSLVFVPGVSGDHLLPVVIQGWTLSFEMFFYAIFAGALMAPARFRLALVLGVIAGLAGLHFVFPQGHLRAFTDPMILEFAAGAAIGAVWTSSWRAPVVAGLALIGLGLAFLIVHQLADLGGPRVLVWGVPTAAIVAGCALYEKGRTVPEWPWLKFLGDASYSIYIWHVLAAVMAGAVLTRLGVTQPAYAVLSVLIALALALVAYRLIEKPLIDLFHGRSRGSRAIRA